MMIDTTEMDSIIEETNREFIEEILASIRSNGEDNEQATQQQETKGDA